MGNLSSLNFDASSVPAADAFDPLPAGWYPVIITESEMQPTRAGDGEYLLLRLDVIDGEHQGRVVFDRLNLNNPNSKAVEIAQRALSAICNAVGVMSPQDSTELHDRPLMAKLSIRPASKSYDASNDVKGYKAMDGAAPAAPASALAPAADAAAGGKKPWEK